MGQSGTAVLADREQRPSRYPLAHVPFLAAKAAAENGATHITWLELVQDQLYQINEVLDTPHALRGKSGTVYHFVATSRDTGQQITCQVFTDTRTCATYQPSWMAAAVCRPWLGRDTARA